MSSLAKGSSFQERKMVEKQESKRRIKPIPEMNKVYACVAYLGEMGSLRFLGSLDGRLREEPQCYSIVRWLPLGSCGSYLGICAELVAESYSFWCSFHLIPKARLCLPRSLGVTLILLDMMRTFSISSQLLCGSLFRNL